VKAVMAPSASVADFVFGVMFSTVSEAAFVVTRSDRALVCVNQRLEDLVGRLAADLVGQPVDLLFAADPGDGPVVFIDHAGRYEDVALRQVDGYPIYVELTVVHVEHPEHGAIAACTARDTTERRALERELMAKHTALYAAHAELAERNREISLLAGQVSRVGWRAAIGELAAGIAHHLNNPVGALASTVRTLGARLDRIADDAVRADFEQLLGRLRVATGRIEDHVGAVVRLHRAGALDATPRWLDLARELDTALALFTGRLDAISVLRAYGGPLTAHVPQDPLHHVLGNVLENAVGAMPGGGVLQIAVERKDDTWVIAVEDSGSGGAVLGDPLAAAGTGSAGLGLAAAQRLARLWGGDLIQGRCDRGARFEIFVPARERSAQSPTRELQ
jgi:PAS domain S-box-containing protein